MVAKFVVETGDLKGLSFDLEDGDSWVLGRDPSESQFVIDDPLISSQHILARQTPEGIMIENLNESHPLFINENEIHENHYILQDGDTLQLGSQVLRFYEENAEETYEDNSAEILDGEFRELEEENAETQVNDIAEKIDDTADLEPEHEHLEPENREGAQMDENFEDIDRLTDVETPNRQDTILSEEEVSLANIDFGVIETGRWLLKVVGGPNNGAEFYMQTGSSYVLGNDQRTCDIVFQDTSVSRQHARITVSPEDLLTIEDLKSKNGIMINGETIEGKRDLPLSMIVTLGTTSFVVYDREGNMETIISPLLPSIVKVLQQEPANANKSENVEQEEVTPVVLTESENAPEDNSEPAPPSVEKPPQPVTAPKQFGSYLVFTTIIGLFVLAGIGTMTLFRSEPVAVQLYENTDALVEQALKPFPAVRSTFNKANGGLLLLGHVSTLNEKNQLLYNLGMLKFIRSIDDAGIIIDEGVWNEVNSLLTNNPEWKGISVFAPQAGKFVLTGELQTRRQLERVTSYLSLNFPYLDILSTQVVVEEDILNQIQSELQDKRIFDVTSQISNGTVVLNGMVPPESSHNLDEVVSKIRQIPGVRLVNNLVRVNVVETGILNISDHYPVTGKSRIGDKYTVVINGRILSEGNDLDGMIITQITSNHIFLERGVDKFRIDY